MLPCAGRYWTQNEVWLRPISAERNQERIARPGQGKSTGFRTLIVFKAAARAIFVHGFAKNEKDNIERDELIAIKKLAAELLAYDDMALMQAVSVGVLVEVNCDEKTVP